MAYQNPYMNYQTGYQPQDLPIMQSQASYHAPYSNGINWVSGESGAKSWIVGRGESVLLMDSESQCFYLKSADSKRIYRNDHSMASKQSMLADLNDFMADMHDKLKELKRDADTPEERETIDRYIKMIERT